MRRSLTLFGFLFLFAMFLSLSGQAQGLSGFYGSVGRFFHPTTSRSFNMTKTLTQISANRYQLDLGDLGSGGYQFQFDVDANNNLVNWTPVGTTPASPASGFMTADNPGNNPLDNAGLLGTYWTSNVYNNKYDPATKTFFLHYGYGVGATGQNGFTRQVYETITSIKPLLLNSFSPTSGGPGTVITIHGQGFAGINAASVGDSLAYFTGVDTFAVVSDTLLTVRVGNSSSGNIHVETLYGDTASIGTFTFTSLGPVQDPLWQQVGPASIPASRVTFPVIKLSGTNVPYVAYVDSATKRVYATSYNGNTWVSVGNGSVSDGKVGCIGLAIDNNNMPVVAYTDSTVGGKLSVKRFNGTQWQLLGSTGFALMSYQYMNRTVQVDVDGANAVYVLGDTSFVTAQIGFQRFTLFKYSGGNWGFAGPAVIDSFSEEAVLAIDRPANTPFIFYMHSNDIGFVKKLTGGVWTDHYIQNGTPVFYPSLSVVAGVPRFVYQDNNIFGRLTVKGGQAGSVQAIGNERFTRSRALYPNIAVSANGSTFVAFEDDDYNKRISVMTPGTNGVWEYVGNRGSIPATQISKQALATDGNNNIWLVFSDVDNNGRLSVVRRQNVASAVSNIPNVPSPQVYPNPAASVVYLRPDARIASGATYEIWSLGGQKLATGIVRPGTTDIQLNALPAGTYLLKVLKQGVVVQAARFVHAR